MAWFKILFQLTYIFQLNSITQQYPLINQSFGTNDNLRKCLSSRLSPSVRMIYPCNTKINQNSAQYRCDHFDINNLSSIRGGQIPHFPAVIVYVENSNDVQHVIQCANQLYYVVNALSGGHSYEGYGLGSVHNNIIINMEKINYINIDSNAGVGTFGAGARLGPIYYKAYESGKYAINGGVCPWVGLAGHTLGGGKGYLARLYGLLSDNVLEIKAVNAEGKLLTINANQEPELFWGLRGSGGGFSVIVVEFKIKLVKAPRTVTTFSIVWSSNNMKPVIQQYQSLLFNNSEMLTFSDNLYLSMIVSNADIEILIIFYEDELEEFDKVVLLLLATLPVPIRSQIKQRDWLTFFHERSWFEHDGGVQQLLLENLTYPTYYFKGKHLLYKQPITVHSIDRFIDRLASATGRIILEFTPWDGYLSRVSVDESAVAHRDSIFSIQFMTFWNNREAGLPRLKCLNELYMTLYDDSTKYSYINYIDRDVPNWMHVYYGKHRERLIKINLVYDKNKRFYFEKTIESSNETLYSHFNMTIPSLFLILCFLAMLQATDRVMKYICKLILFTVRGVINLMAYFLK